MTESNGEQERLYEEASKRFTDVGADSTTQQDLLERVSRLEQVEQQLEQFRHEHGERMRELRVRLTWIAWLAGVPYLIMAGLFGLSLLLGIGSSLLSDL